MRFIVYSELSYEVFTPCTFIFNIQPAKTATQTIIEETIFINPFSSYHEFTLNNCDARLIKMEVSQGTFFTIACRALVEVQHRLVDEATLLQSIPISQLSHEVIPYLFPSRHCQSDKLIKLAAKEFKALPDQYSRAVAINNWIYNHIDYISGTTDAGTSAYDTLIQRQGVCKDFAHLGIALCRAMDIPARYFTGYACNLNPPDFHACFEAYIGGLWIFFDATKLVPINGLVKIANSKDAADAAVANIFGNANCTYMNVQCTPGGEGFIPYSPSPFKVEALSCQL